MKKILAMIMTLVIFVTMPTFGVAKSSSKLTFVEVSKSTTVVLNDELKFSSIIKEGKFFYAPAVEVLGYLGNVKGIQYNPKTKTLTFTWNGKKASAKVGESSIILPNSFYMGKSLYGETIQIYNGKVYFPVSFLTDSSDYDLSVSIGIKNRIEFVKTPVTMTLRIVDHGDGDKALPNVEVWIGDVRYGITNSQGIVQLKNVPYGYNTLTLKDQKTGRWDKNGFNQKSKNQATTLWFNLSENASVTGEFPYNESSNGKRLDKKQESKDIIFDLTQLNLTTSSNKNSVEIQFDKTIPADVQQYIKSLVSEIDPIVRALLGDLNIKREIKIVYQKDMHISLSPDKSILYFGTLPDPKKQNDSWDGVFTVNYIHQFLTNGKIPQISVRSSENLAHTIRECVGMILYQQGKRTIEYHGIQYYKGSYQSYRSLSPESILNLGGTDTLNTGFQKNNYLLSSSTYESWNAISIENAKSIWLKVYLNYINHTGKYDFFKNFRAFLESSDNSSIDNVYRFLENQVPYIDGLKTTEWIKKQNLFCDIEKEFVLDLVVANGTLYNNYGPNNPTTVYPITFSRTPGQFERLLVNVDVYKLEQSKKEKIFSGTVKSGREGNQEFGGLSLGSLNLQPGSYEINATTDFKGNSYTSQVRFNQFNEEASENYFIDNIMTHNDYVDNPIMVKFDPSIPQSAQEYIKSLSNVIDPVMRKFAGAPFRQNTLTIKYDANGMASMNSDMTVLNITTLPQVKNGIDSSFDSFYMIEYFHMFHRGLDIPNQQARYSESISQAMKVVVSHYLKQMDLRQTSLEPIPYHLTAQSVFDELGSGVLINLGPDSNKENNPMTLKHFWKAKDPLYMNLNSFITDYGALPYLVLADRYYQIYGEYGFFKTFQVSLQKVHPKTVDAFTQLLDRIFILNVNNEKTSQWLLNTATFKALGDDKVFLTPLLLDGNRFTMTGSGSPQNLYPFAVIRDGSAEFFSGDIKIVIKNQKNEIVMNTIYKTAYDYSNSFLNGISLKALPNGTYTVKMSVERQGIIYEKEKTFTISK